MSQDLRELIYDSYNPADDVEPGFWDECTGEFHPAHKAGDRYTGPRLQVYTFGARAFAGDPLTIMAICRRNMLAAKRAGAWDWRSVAAEYDYFRLIAMRPSSRSRLRQADMLALASRCLNRVSEMRNFA